jgi:hypothetical protein
MRARLFVSQERVMVAHRDRSSLLKHALQGGHDGFGLKLLHEVVFLNSYNEIWFECSTSGYPADC